MKDSVKQAASPEWTEERALLLTGQMRQFWRKTSDPTDIQLLRFIRGYRGAVLRPKKFQYCFGVRDDLARKELPVLRLKQLGLVDLAWIDDVGPALIITRDTEHSFDLLGKTKGWWK